MPYDQCLVINHEVVKLCSLWSSIIILIAMPCLNPERLPIITSFCF